MLGSVQPGHCILQVQIKRGSDKKSFHVHQCKHKKYGTTTPTKKGKCLTPDGKEQLLISGKLTLMKKGKKSVLSDFTK